MVTKSHIFEMGFKQAVYDEVNEQQWYKRYRKGIVIHYSDKTDWFFLEKKDGSLLQVNVRSVVDMIKNETSLLWAMGKMIQLEKKSAPIYAMIDTYNYLAETLEKQDREEFREWAKKEYFTR